MARVLILGYGNPLRSDDGLGWQVAVQLFRTNQSCEVLVLPCHQLTPELAEPISRCETVLFIDSTRQGTPGEFRCEELRSQAGPVSFTHDLSPRALLDLSSELFGGCPRAYLMTICGECFEFGETLSVCVSQSLPELKLRVRDLVAESLATKTSAPRALGTVVNG
jgi:hydrogenase maturation protease